MSQQQPSKTWNKPELNRLGRLADVANGQFPGPQGGGAKS